MSVTIYLLAIPFHIQRGVKTVHHDHRNVVDKTERKREGEERRLERERKGERDIKKLLTCDPLPYPEGREDGPPRPRDVTVQSEREEEREGQ